MNNIKVTTAGLRRLAVKVSRASNLLGGQGLRELVSAAGFSLVQQFEANIDSFTPGKVRDIKQATKERKAKKGWSVYPILKASGDMVRSMVSRARKSGRGGWTISVDFQGLDRQGARNADKARGHLEGTNHLPVRDFTTVPKAWSKQFLKDVRQRMGWK